MDNSTRLTKQQLAILRFMYSHRFVTTRQVQRLLGKRHVQQAQQRLNTLLNKRYIGRRYSSDDKLLGRYAAYFLLPAGMEIIKEYADSKALRLMRKDPAASQRFIDHNIAVGDVAADFTRIYKTVLDRVTFLTKTDIMLMSTHYHHRDWDGEDGHDLFIDALPKPLPDGLVDGWPLDGDLDDFPGYFVEVWHEHVPFWVYRKRILYLIEYTDDETWEDWFAGSSVTPPFLLVCDSPVLQHRVQRYLRRTYDDLSHDYQFLVTNRQILAAATGDDQLWTRVDDETAETIRLTDVPKLTAT